MEPANIINAKDIHRSYALGEVVTHILKGIDITVKENEFLAIMGRSGAGKSTLLYQLSALDEPTQGEVTLNGVNVTALSDAQRTRFRLNTLGYVFQDYALVPDLNARENVMLPILMRGESWVEAKRIADAMLDEVGLPGKYTNLPGQLSGGEQQRVSIARAIAGKPKILFADEPTANLDSVSGAHVIDLITKLHRESGQTVVMVTHEKEYTRNCTRVVEMEDGKITNDYDPQKYF